EFDSGGFVAAEAQAAVAHANFDRVAQRRDAEKLDDLAFENSQFPEPLHQRRLAANGADAAAGPDWKVIQRRHAVALSTSGRTKMWQSHSPRRLSRQSPTRSKHGLPGCTTWIRQPERTPSSAMRPTQRGSPETSWISAHSPDRS